MRKNTVLVFFFLLFLISCLAGCMYTAPSGTPVAAQPSPPPAVTTPEETPGPIITAVPATELARIEQQNLGTDSGTGSMYRFQGILTISGGAYSSVKMIMQYPDGNEYVFDAGEMGGAGPAATTVILYPDAGYQYQTANYFIVLDGKEYATNYQYTDGTIYRIATTDTAVPVARP